MRRLGFQPVECETARLEAYPTAIWLATATKALL